MTKIKSTLGCLSITIAISLVFAAGNNNTSEHQSLILDGVTPVLRTCTPASMSLMNEKSFSILSGENGGIRRAHVAGVEWESGRIVAYSHTSFYVNGLPNGDIGSNVKLLINSVNWVRKKYGTKIGVYAEKQLETILLEHGFEMRVLSGTNFNNLTFLEQFDALVVSYLESDLRFTNVRTYVRNGGGLLIGATAWTSQINQIETYWGNVVLQHTGIFYVPFYSFGIGGCDGYGDAKCSYATSVEYLQDTNAFQAWHDLKQFNWSQPMPLVKLRQMIETLSDRLRYGPSNATLNGEVNLEVPRILKRIPSIAPTAKAPVSERDEKDYITAHRQWTLFCNSFGMTDKVPPHPAAMSFPGVVSTIHKTKDLNKEIVEIDERIHWHSTGLYARPGEEIEILALEADGSMIDLELQLGIHSDNLETLDSWKRCPHIVFRNKMKNGSATIANPFGGAIYIISSKHRNDPLKFVIKGGIRSPSYFLGKTKLNQWQNEIRNYPAPWGELVGKNIIISLQASLLSQLYDPEKVLQFWDRVMDVIADLVGIPHERDTPARFVADVQISVGSMHSGYPIMYHLDSQEHCVNLQQMKADPWKIWGFLHELGHNHQQSDWTFKGTGEVTNNLFALYVLHTIFDCPTNSTPSYSDISVAKRIKNYVDNGKQFSQWQSNWDLAFDTYVQLQKAFGWSAYRKVFANYRQLSGDERPKNDEEKIDLWMIMFSKVVEENLADFFISWGFAISDEAVALVSNLPPTSLRILQLF